MGDASCFWLYFSPVMVDAIAIFCYNFSVIWTRITCEGGNKFEKPILERSDGRCDTAQRRGA